MRYSDFRGLASQKAESHVVNCVFLATPLLALILPKIMAGMLPVLGLLAGMHMLATRRYPASLWRPSYVALVFGAFFLLAAGSAAWALNPSSALSRGLAGVGAIVAAHLIQSWFSVNLGLARSALRWSFLGLAIGLGFIAFELTSGQTISTAVAARLGLEEPHLYHLNLNLAVASFLLWPAILFARVILDRRSAALLGFALAALVLSLAFFSEHETSKLSLILAFAALVLATILPRVASGALNFGWLAAVLLMVPFAMFAHERLMLEQDSWLQRSAQHRIIIWGNVADRVLEAPVLGHGARSIYEINRQDKLAGRGAAVIGMQALPPHAHNIYVQTWFELGALGAILAAIGGVFILQNTSRFGNSTYPVLAGASVNGMVQIFPSFELWQIWYLSTLTFAVIMTWCAARLLQSVEEGENANGAEADESLKVTPG